jgi:small subunit ribosomal protein S18
MAIHTVKKRKRKTDKPCAFCVQKKEPDYKDSENLKKYLSVKYRLIPRYETGLCRKHQSRMSVAVKRARFIGQIPYLQRVK